MILLQEINEPFGVLPSTIDVVYMAIYNYMGIFIFIYFYFIYIFHLYEVCQDYGVSKPVSVLGKLMAIHRLLKFLPTNG